LLTAFGLTHGGSSTVHIYTQTVHRTAKLKQNIQNRTYIIIKIHTLNKNINITIKIHNLQNKTKAYKHTTIYTMIKKWNQKNMKERDKRNNHTNSKLHMIYASSNNVRHLVTKTFTTLHYTSPNYTSLHFTALLDTSLPFI